MFSSTYTTACNAFNDLKNDFEWCGHNLLPLEQNIRRDASCIDARKFDLLTESEDSFSIFEGPQEINIASTNLNMSSINCEYWKNSNTLIDFCTNPQTFSEAHRIPEAPLLQVENKNLCSTLGLHNSITKIQTAINDNPCKSISTLGLCTRNLAQSSHCSHHTGTSGSVEIKVEVDPNLYVNYETSADSEHWSNSHHNNVKYPVNTNISDCLSAIAQKNLSARNDRTKNYIDTSETKNRNVDNEQDILVVDMYETRPRDLNNPDFLETNLDDNESEISQETESEITDDSDASELSVESSQTKTPSDIISVCDSKEQLDSQLSKFYEFKCVKCDQTFLRFEFLVKHCKDKHRVDACVSCCGKSLWDKNTLVKHMLKHEHTFRCAECRKFFTDETLWKNHLKQHLQKPDVDPFQCPHCDKKFSSKYGLANHMNLHLPEGERPYKCQHCSKGFGAKHAMTKHERTHLPDEERLSYVCDICGKRFGYASTLDGHQRHVHQNERPFVCHICAKTFPIKGALTYHLTTHEVQDRVQCSQCGIW